MPDREKPTLADLKVCQGISCWWT